MDLKMILTNLYFIIPLLYNTGAITSKTRYISILDTLWCPEMDEGMQFVSV
jgi:hypothetical protein